MTAPRLVALVMAGGEGSRLRPLTSTCPKPALPFGGSHRIIDFALGNLFNSGVSRALVLMQYRPLTLVQHLAATWCGPGTDRFVQCVLPAEGSPGFRGTADAVAQCMHHADAGQVDLVAVFAADHVYRMDVRQMAAFHRARGAQASIAAIPVPLAEAGAFGVICADADGRVCDFQEKPARAEPMPGEPDRAFASMGNYLFDPQVLRAALAEAAARGEHDFGRHVLPRLARNNRVFAYDFSTNSVPGVRQCEEPAYWRDVGTLDSYVGAHWDLLGPRPRFRKDNEAWPIRGQPEARGSGSAGGARVSHSIIGPGAQVRGADLRHCVLQRNARVGPGSRLERCILMEGACVGPGVQLRDMLVEGGNPMSTAAAGGLRIAPAHRAGEAPRRHSSGRATAPPRSPGMTPGSGAMGAAAER